VIFLFPAVNPDDLMGWLTDEFLVSTRINLIFFESEEFLARMSEAIFKKYGLFNQANGTSIHLEATLRYKGCLYICLIEALKYFLVLKKIFMFFLLRQKTEWN